MYEDLESDFWKEIFVHVQHKNMVRTNGEPLKLSDTQTQFQRFALAHPEIKVEINNSASYVTWEFFYTETIKLRLFIQNGIKATLMQRTSGDLVKIADAKFYNNPFPEIEEMLANKNEYLRQLNDIQNEGVRQNKKQNLCAQFIKAQLKMKYKTSQAYWTLNIRKDDFIVSLFYNENQKDYVLTENNFMDEIKKMPCY